MHLDARSDPMQFPPPIGQTEDRINGGTTTGGIILADCRRIPFTDPVPDARFSFAIPRRWYFKEKELPEIFIAHSDLEERFGVTNTL